VIISSEEFLIGPHADDAEKKFVSAPLGYRPRTRYPATGKVADGTEIKDLLYKKFSNRNLTKETIFALDVQFYLPTVYEVKNILESSRVGRMDYTSEGFDCDDFAFGVKGEFSLYAYRNLGKNLNCGFAFGVMSGNFEWEAGPHMACFFVAQNRRIYLVEPRKKLIPRRNGRARRMGARDQLKSPKKCFACKFALL